MPDSTAYDPHSVDDMNRDAERWHEVTWDALGNRLDHATFAQLRAIARGGIGEPETGND